MNRTIIGAIAALIAGFLIGGLVWGVIAALIILIGHNNILSGMEE